MPRHGKDIRRLSTSLLCRPKDKMRPATTVAVTVMQVEDSTRGLANHHARLAHRPGRQADDSPLVGFRVRPAGSLPAVIAKL